MSFNRENVTWQSADGSWNLGFYAVTWEGSEADGYDPEWDVEYDYDRFEWVTRGHASPDDAYAARSGRSNPGGTTECSQADDAAQCATFDAMAGAWQAARERSAAASRRTGLVVLR